MQEQVREYGTDYATLRGAAIPFNEPAVCLLKRRL